MRPILALLFFFVFLAGNKGQSVSTLVPTNVGDDMHFAADGNIYSSHYGGVYFRKINPNTGVVDTILAANTSTIGAIEMDEALNIYTCSYDLGWVGKFAEGDNTITNLATSLSGPAGITHDGGGNLYVATNQNHRIIKIKPDGTKETFVQGSPLFWPTGITIDTAGNLYVANMFSGQIIRVTPEKQMSTLATLPAVSDQTPDIAYLTWTHGKLYICHFDKHVIYEMNPETGSFQIIAGSGQPGYEDGPALQAKFQNPTGIVASQTGDTLYITDGVSPNQRLRMLMLNDPVSGTIFRQNLTTFHHAFPNPVDDSLSFEFTLEKGQRISFDIVDAAGKTHLSRPEQMFPSGKNLQKFGVGEMAPGAYFLLVKSGKLTETLKFIKK